MNRQQLEDLIHAKHVTIKTPGRSLGPHRDCEVQYKVRKMMLTGILLLVLLCQPPVPLLLALWRPRAILVHLLSYDQLLVVVMTLTVLVVLWCPCPYKLVFHHGVKSTESERDIAFQPGQINGSEVTSNGVPSPTCPLNQTTNASAVTQSLKQDTNQRHLVHVESDNVNTVTVVLADNTNVGPHGTVNYLLPQTEEATSYSRHQYGAFNEVENLEDTRLCAVNPSGNVSALVRDIENGRTPKAALLFAFVLTHCPNGVSIELLCECSGILRQGMSVCGDHLAQDGMTFITDLVSSLCAYWMIKADTFCLNSASMATVALDSLACRELQSLHQYSEDQPCVRIILCNMLTRVLGARKKTVRKLHLEAAKIAKTYLKETSDLQPLQKSELHLALGKRLSKVGGLQEAFDQVDMAIAGFDSCLNVEGDTDEALKIKRCLVNAYLAKGKMARRLGKSHPSLEESLMYLEQAQHLQMEIDGCHSPTDITTPIAARIAVAICETYLCTGKYSEALSTLQNGQFVGVVWSDTRYHQAQYFANLGCAFQFNGSSMKAYWLLHEAIDVSATDNSNYRRPLYFTLMARVLVEISQEDQTWSESHLQLADNYCRNARDLLTENHSECHRFSALHEMCLASICLARRRIFPGQRGDLLAQAISHAVRALTVYQVVYCNAMIHPNVAATLAASARRLLFGDAKRTGFIASF